MDRHPPSRREPLSKQNKVDASKTVASSPSPLSGFNCEQDQARQEKERALQALREAMARVEALGGAELLAAAVRTKGDTSLDTLEADLQKERQEKAFPAYFFDKLKEKGLVREEAGYTIVDVDALRQKELRELGLDGPAFAALYTKGIYAVFAAGFQGRRIVSTADWKQAQQEGVAPQPLWPLYLPRTVQAATDVQSIKNARFYFAPWNMRGMKSIWGNELPLADGSMTMEELAVSGMIYHPSCGDGKRDASGALLVRDQETREYRKLTAAWFTGQGVYGTGTQRNLQSGSGWVAHHPILERRGLLKASDFSVQSTHVSDSLRGIESVRYVERQGTKNGSITFNGIVHHIGREFIGKDILVANISSDVGLIMEKASGGALVPVYTFHIYQKDDPEILALRQAGKFASMGLGKIDRRAIPANLLQRSSAQDTEQERIVRVYLESRQKTSHGVRLGSEIDKKSHLSPESTVALSKWMMDVGNAHRAVFKEFISDYGEMGAKFCLAFAKSEHGVLFRFCRQAGALGEVAVRAVMACCVQLDASGKQDAIQLTREVLTDQSESTRALEGELEREIRNRWKRTLGQLATENKGLTFDQLTVRLESLKQENALFSSVFRVAFKGKSAQTALELMKGLSFDTLPAREIDVRTKKEMTQIFDANWSDQDGTAAKAFKGSLEKKLQEEGDQTKFYLLRRDGEVMAFIRFDDRPDLGKNVVYGGSLNVHPVFRQSGIGEALMKNTIDEVAKEHVIRAHVVPDAVVGTAYVEQMRCVITGVDLLKDPNTGEVSSILSLRRDDKRIYRTRQTSTNWEALKTHSVPGVEVKRFDISTQKELFLQTIRNAAAQGKVVTRYLADRDHPSIRWIALERDIEPLAQE